MLSTRADQRPGSARGLKIGGGGAVRTPLRAIHQPGCACRGGRRGSNHRRWNELSMTRTWCRRPSVASSTPSSATRAFASRCGEEPDEPERGSRQPRAATLLALLLLVGAGFGLALRFGIFGTARANQPLLLPVGTDRVRELDLEPNTGAGATTVSTSAVTDAVTTEIAGYRGVERTSGRLIRDQDSLDLVLTVTINNRADLDAVRRRIEEHAVSHTRQALGQSQLRSSCTSNSPPAHPDGCADRRPGQGARPYGGSRTAAAPRSPPRAADLPAR